jgi:phage N-6-adenine-methyltransferase
LKSVQHLQSIAKRDNWATPKTIFDEICLKYDVSPRLDVAAQHGNQKCDRFYTKEDDSLTQEFTEDFWCNPPYSEITKFVSHCYSQHLKNNVTGVMLTFNKTDTKWWHGFVEGKAEVHFRKGRIKFVDPDTHQISKNSAPYPSCIIIWRRK